MKITCCLILVLLVATPVYYAQTNTALLLFGGDGHKVFLGCLNCSASSQGSVCNKYGAGSKYDANSIWNKYGNFGSKYSQDSPWNKYSSSAPIIVDKDGKSYGYFSTNKYHPDRTRISWLVQALDFQAAHDDLEATQDLMCGSD
jgi:hypothetical protein